MEDINTKLQELDKGELELYIEWRRVISKHLKEDTEIENGRAKEEREWSDRLRRLNEEQDVSQM